MSDKLSDLRLVAKNIQQNQNKLDKLKARIHNASPRFQKMINNEIKDLEKENLKELHEIHCIAVELNIAQPEPDKYGEIDGIYFREPNIQEKQRC